MRHLRHEADCHAWPWVSVEEFGRASCVFDRERARVRLRDRMMVHGSPEITRELIDHCWAQGRERLCEAICVLARSSLACVGDAWHLIPDPNMPGREILRWRYLGLALPPGLLMAAASESIRPPVHVDVLHSSFGPVGPVAHLHVHVYAACSFEVLWTHLMSRRARLRWKDPELPAEWALSGRTADDWEQALTFAAIARRVVAFVGRHPELSLAQAIDRVGAADAELVADALAQLRTGRLRGAGRVTRAMMFRVATRNPQRWKTPMSLEDVWRNDPIADGGVWPEGAMLQRAFIRVQTERAGAIEAILVQYIRIKCMLYRLLVCDPADRGLDSFVHKFRQMRPYRDGLEVVLPDLAMVERGIDLRAVEVRTAPPESVTRVKEMAERLEETADRRDRDLEAGWVFHFIREGRGETTGARYQAQYRQMRADVSRLRQALTLRPWLLATIRGLDIAGPEREGPLWLAAPFFAQMRAFSRELASRTSNEPLRYTFHAGEDFRHLASGLRAIHEPMRWGLVARGDRLGHALALGLDPAKWCAKHPRVLIPRWERILDLAWMIGALEGSARDLEGLYGDGFGLQLARMRNELARRLDESGVGAAPDNVVKLHGEVFGDVETLPWLMVNRRDRPAASDPRYLAWMRVFGERSVQTAFDEPCLVETAPEMPLLLALSRALVLLVARWQMAIEVNPSSNLLVAGLEDLLDQPIFRLHPLDPGEAIALPVTLNADDPLTVATTLADEYAYAWVAMVLVGGVAPGRAHAWLREAGNASWRARFTLPAAQRRASKTMHAVNGRGRFLR